MQIRLQVRPIPLPLLQVLGGKGEEVDLPKIPSKMAKFHLQIVGNRLNSSQISVKNLTSGIPYARAMPKPAHGQAPKRQ